MNRPLLLSILSVVIMHSSFAMQEDERPPLFRPVSKDIVPITAAIVEARRNKPPSSPVSPKWQKDDLTVPEAIKNRNAKDRRRGLPLITPRLDHHTTVS